MTDTNAGSAGLSGIIERGRKINCCTQYNVTAQWIEEVLQIFQNAKEAIDFFDRVVASSDKEKAAVGNDHWNWVISALRKMS